MTATQTPARPAAAPDAELLGDAAWLLRDAARKLGNGWDQRGLVARIAARLDALATAPAPAPAADVPPFLAARVNGGAE